MSRRISSFIKITFILFFFLSTGRMALFFFNPLFFKGDGLNDILWYWFAGLRFDAATIFLLWLLVMIPVFVCDFFSLYRKNIFLIWSLWFFLLIFLVYLPEWIDVGYFPFIRHRSTKDLFFMIGGQADILSLLPFLWNDFWYLWLSFLFSFIITCFLLFRFGLLKKFFYSGKELNRWQRILQIPVLIILFLLAFRGTSRTPLDKVDALKYTRPERIHLVMNSTFSIIKSLDKNSTPYLKKFKPESDCQPGYLFNPPKNNQTQFLKKNIIILILEGISKEYTSLSGDTISFTPFLDSLMNHSIVFSSAYANGYKSIEGIPAILSSLPSLTEDPILNSDYNYTNISSFASLLKPFGYRSYFFHGGYNGTMNFDTYASIAGYDGYIGYHEFPDKEQDDGAWGIWDEPFLRFAGEIMDTIPSPFHIALFTLSSHHPFRIPSKYKNLFRTGHYENLASVQYADYSLKKFFSNFRNRPWFKDALFVITADHTSLSEHPFYNTRVGQHSIPLMIFDPSRTESKKVIHKTMQHADILPTVMDYLYYPKSFYCMGSSVFDTTQSGGAFFYYSGLFYGVRDSIFCTLNTHTGHMEYRDFKENLLGDTLSFKNHSFLHRDMLRCIHRYSCFLK